MSWDGMTSHMPCPHVKLINPLCSSSCRWLCSWRFLVFRCSFIQCLLAMAPFKVRIIRALNLYPIQSHSRSHPREPPGYSTLFSGHILPVSRLGGVLAGCWRISISALVEVRYTNAIANNGKIRRKRRVWKSFPIICFTFSESMHSILQWRVFDHIVELCMIECPRSCWRGVFLFLKCLESLSPTSCLRTSELRPLSYF
jgi:hypothetical protein